MGVSMATMDEALLRSVVRLYVEGVLSPGDVERLVGWSRWDLLDVLTEHPEWAPIDADFYGTLAALEGTSRESD